MYYIVANNEVAQALPEGAAIPIDSLSTVTHSAAALAGHTQAMVMICSPDVRAQAVAKVRAVCPAIMLYAADPLACDTPPRTNEDVAAMICDKSDTLIAKSVIVPPGGVQDITSIQSPNPAAQKRYTTSIPALDRLMGGLRPGELTEICASAGTGKSTLGKNFAINVIGHSSDSALIYSGEMDPGQEKTTIDIMANGGLEEGLTYWDDPMTQMRHYSVTEDRAKEIAAKLQGRLFLASGITTIDALLAQASIMVTHFGVGLVIVDNLMCLTIGDGGREADRFAAQAKIVGKLKRFAVDYQIHLLLILHPRKGSAVPYGTTPSMDVISGNSDIINLADNVLFLSRNEPREDKEGPIPTPDTTLHLLKNRALGKLGRINLEFDPPSRTYYESPIDPDPASPTAGDMVSLLEWFEPPPAEEPLKQTTWPMPDKRFEQTTLREISPDWVASDDDGDLPF